MNYQTVLQLFFNYKNRATWLDLIARKIGTWITLKKKSKQEGKPGKLSPGPGSNSPIEIRFVTRSIPSGGKTRQEPSTKRACLVLKCTSASAMLASLRSRALPSLSSSIIQSWKLGFPRTISSSAENYEYLNLQEIEKILTDVQAGDVKVIPVNNQCDWTDFMVIATGTSTWHVRNIAQALIYKVKQKQQWADRKVLPSVQGQEGGKWVVIDAGKVIVHALDEKARDYYNLEGRWTSETTSKMTPLNQDLEKAFVKIRPKNNSKKKPVAKSA